MTTIEFAESLDLPVEVATQPCGILGRRGSGKTYAAKKLFEGVYGAGVQVVVLDPVGVWAGLRRGPDGKSPGLPIPVLGGAWGDVPLGDHDGVAAGRMLVERRLSAVVDVSHLSKSKRGVLVAALCEEVFRLKKLRRYPLHLIFEEAQLFAPQRVGRGTERMVGAVEDLCRLGRNFGIGNTLVSQRPQSVNKEVLSQVEVLLLLQLSGPHERKAVEAWVVDKGEDVGEIVSELPGLSTGEGYLWSPSWLRICKRIRVGRILTFDSSATPEVGEETDLTAPAAVEVDAEDLQEALTAAGAAAKEEDPRELKRRIRELEAKLHTPVEPERVEVPALSPEILELLGRIEIGLDQARRDASEKLEILAAAVGAAEEVFADLWSQLKSATPEALPPAPSFVVDAERIAATDGDLGALPRGQRLVLSAVVQCGGRATGKRAAMLAGYSIKSSTMRNIVSGLRTAGLVEGSLGDELVATAEGLAVADDVEPLPTGQALRAYWLAKIPGGAVRAMLSAAIDAYPAELTYEDLEARTDYSATSSTMRNALSKLRTLELIEGTGAVRAADDLFQGGRRR